MEGIYSFALDFYKKGHLTEAEAFFRFLCIYDMNNADYVLGLGCIFQQQQHYQKAADAYALAYAMKNIDFRPLLYAGQCYLLLHNPQEARQCFISVTQSNSPDSLKSKAQAYLDATA